MRWDPRHVLCVFRVSVFKLLRVRAGGVQDCKVLGTWCLDSESDACRLGLRQAAGRVWSADLSESRHFISIIWNLADLRYRMSESDLRYRYITTSKVQPSISKVGK
jgi:hypothetical protein